MNTKEKAPEGRTSEAVNNLFLDTTDNKIAAKVPRVKAGTKEHVILSALADGRKLTRFDAIQLHDTALNSTVSTLQGKGLRIHREWIKVPCLNGQKLVDCCRYSLLPDQLPRARELLGAQT